MQSSQISSHVDCDIDCDSTVFIESGINVVVRRLVTVDLRALREGATAPIEKIEK